MRRPTRQQLAVLQELEWRERGIAIGRIAALPEEVTRDYARTMGHDKPDLPHTVSAARNCLKRMVGRGWVHELINTSQRSYEITDEGRKAAKPRAL